MEPSAAGYLPFDGRPFRLRMGLRPLDLDRWIEVDDRRDVELVEKESLLATRHGDVVAFVEHPDVDAAAVELDELVCEWLGEHGVDFAEVDPGLHPIDRCGRRTQEDWCLLVDLDATGPILAAASVCFPTRWTLRDKIGQSTAAIHAPVSRYDDQLSVPVDRFLDRLAPDGPVWRLNWNVLDDGALHQPVRPSRSVERAGPRPAGDFDVGHDIWLRVERQTLRRLPGTGAIAFSIRVHQQSLASLAGQRGVLERLAAAIDALPEPTFRYKGLPAFAVELRRWIEAAIEQSTQPLTPQCE